MNDKYRGDSLTHKNFIGSLINIKEPFSTWLIAFNMKLIDKMG